MSYGPFFGGKRVCLGKTFAEMTAKIIAPALLWYFDYKFVNEDHYKNKPAFNLSQP